MSKIKYINKCKICGNTDLEKVLELEEQFLSPTFIKSNEESNLKDIRTPLTLVLCSKKKNKKSCGHLQLLEEVEPDLLYREYFYRSATNDTMKNDLFDVVKKTSDIANPQEGDVIVDIGSNDNTLLNFYNKNYFLVGFEPALNIKHIDEGKNIEVINDYFNKKSFSEKFNKKAKIITSCAMFYDLSEPPKFVSDINDILHSEGVWCVQISYLLSMIKNMNFYDICHEHLSYYSLETFEILMKQNGLKVFDGELNGVNGGSIRLYVCKTENNKFINAENSKRLENLRLEEKKYNLTQEETFYNYQKSINTLKKKTNDYIKNILDRGGKVIALGASTKGNILLQHFGLDKSKVPFISERNPDKVGLKCVGTDIELISEKHTHNLKPNSMIVLPWYFKEEIVKREQEYIQNGGELFFPMPYPHYVNIKGEHTI